MASRPDCLTLLKVTVRLAFTELWSFVKRIRAFLLCQNRNRRRPRPRLLRQASLPEALREELELNHLTSKAEAEEARRICRAEWVVVVIILIAVFCGIYQLYTTALTELLAFLRTKPSQPSSSH